MEHHKIIEDMVGTVVDMVVVDTAVEDMDILRSSSMVGTQHRRSNLCMYSSPSRVAEEEIAAVHSAPGCWHAVVPKNSVAFLWGRD